MYQKVLVTSLKKNWVDWNIQYKLLHNKWNNAIYLWIVEEIIIFKYCNYNLEFRIIIWTDQFIQSHIILVADNDGKRFRYIFQIAIAQ